MSKKTLQPTNLMSFLLKSSNFVFFRPNDDEQFLKITSFFNVLFLDSFSI